MAMSSEQADLFGPSLPEGFQYRPDILAADEEQELVARFGELDLKPFQFQGYEGNRRVISFGLHYDFADRRLKETREIPSFLLPLRGRAAGFADIAPDELPHVLVTEYAPGAGIGWHRDRPVFGDVIGVSFLSECRFRFRRRAGPTWERAEQVLAPRSAYLMRGPARTVWEHSIPAGEQLRYSVTFRTLKASAGS
jgi:alkylated DNA repair dioxygenase AlkB